MFLQAKKLSKYQDLEIEVNRMWETNKKNNYAVEPILKQPTLHNGHLFTTPFLVDSQHGLLFKPADNDHLSGLV